MTSVPLEGTVRVPEGSDGVQVRMRSRSQLRAWGWVSPMLRCDPVRRRELSTSKYTGAENVPVRVEMGRERANPHAWEADRVRRLAVQGQGRTSRKISLEGISQLRRL